MEAFVKTFLLTVLLLCTNVFAEETQPLVVKNLETCFSPNESCDQKLIGVINSAKKTLDVAIFSITHPEIAAAITAAKNRGVDVRMVVDKGQSESTRSQTDELVQAKVPLKIGNSSRIMHDKFCIVDRMILETGSFNYTMSATVYNTENQIYITDKNVIKRYQDNFEKLWSDGLEKTRAQ
jgi:phosphatidylserine/phosphatidylglycerophosphate/cardiolipin synthase-like enzyme